MGRPRQVSDAQIAAATRAALLDHGPQVATSVIAERLGVSQAALFKRMGSREALLVAALCPVGRPAVFDRLEASPRLDGSLQRQLEGFVIELLTVFDQVVPGLVLAKASGLSLDQIAPRGMPPPPVLMRSALASWLEKAHKQRRVRKLDFEAAADALLGALEARAFLRHVGGKSFITGDDAVFCQKLVATHWHGLAPAAARSGR